MTPAQESASRRSFLRTAAGTGLLYVSPKTAFGTDSNSAIEIGIVGCGGRGIYIGDFFQQKTNSRIVALADPIPSQIDLLRTQLKIDSARVHTGVNGYRELVNSKLDAVVIESPPYFHPEQAAEVVAAGKHLFLAKPVGVDVAGCQSIIETGRRAKGRLSTWVDFQTRMRPLYQEAAMRVHRGDIGRPAVAEVIYHNGPQILRRNPADTPLQHHLRNWLLDRKLSGEIIVEQDIHMIDVADWFLGSHPLEAVGRAGLAGSERQGDMLDYFSVQYSYPNGVLADFVGTRFTHAYRDQCVRIQGTQGTVDSHYMGAVNIIGEHPWKGAETDNTRLGAVTNVENFVESIRSGKPIDNTAQAAQSNLTAILGRTAVYQKRSVTWDEMMRSGEKIEAQIGA